MHYFDSDSDVLASPLLLIAACMAEKGRSSSSELDGADGSVLKPSTLVISSSTAEPIETRALIIFSADPSVVLRGREAQNFISKSGSTFYAFIIDLGGITTQSLAHQQHVLLIEYLYLHQPNHLNPTENTPEFGITVDSCLPEKTKVNAPHR